MILIELWLAGSLACGAVWALAGYALGGRRPSAARLREIAAREESSDRARAAGLQDSAA